MSPRVCRGVSLALGLALLLIAGCGGCPEAARRQLEEGDSIMKEVVPKADEVLYQLDSLFTNYAAGVNTEPVGVRFAMDEYGRAASGLVSRSGEARKAYENALGMKGAGACAEYAKQRLAAIGQIERVPRAAEKGFKVIKSGQKSSVAFDEGPLYMSARSLVQIDVEMRYAMGYADTLGKKLNLEAPAE